jgi:glycosyltransferase involved in cell wall biosynthesis
VKILFCNKYNYPFSGTESYLFAVMDLIRARGHEPALFSMAGPRGEQTPYEQHFVPLKSFKNGRQGLWNSARLAASAIYSREARLRLRRLIAEFQPDVAHVRNIYHHLSPSILWELKAQGVPVIYHMNDFKLLCPSYNFVSHGQACERCAGGKFWHVMTEGCYSGGLGQSVVLAAEAYAHKWLKTYQACVDCFLAPSEFVKAKLIENGWDSAKIRVLAHFQHLPEDPPPILESAPILYFGRLSPEKGVDDLLRAMQRLRHVRLQIAGDGPQRLELEQLASSLQLQNVEFLGQLPREALDQAIARSQFTVFPSHAYETLGKSILESYAWARPVIASDLGSRRELMRNHETGLLFPVGRADALAAAISFLAGQPALAKQMGIAGRELVRRNHAPDDHYASLTSLYAQLANKKSKTKPGPVALPPDASQSKPLKIAFIGGRGVVSKYSGIETYYEEAGKQLAAMGHEITIYCRSYFTPRQKQYASMHLVRLLTIRSKHLETAVHTFLSTCHALFGPCDIVHFHALGPALFSFLPRLTGKKTVVTVQGLDWQRQKWGAFAASVLRLGEKASASFPNATMVVSRTLQERYRAHHGVETVYVPNAATPRTKIDARILSRWSLEPGKYILFLGRFSPEKNCHLLIQAYEQIQTDVKLVLAGGSSHTGAYTADLRRYASDKILLLDWVSGPDLDALLTQAMLFVLPSSLEGLSLALLDAMGAGICVLASDIAENREVVDGAGFTFRAGDLNDLSKMLRLLIDNPGLRHAAAGIAQQRIRESYQWPQVARQIEQVYRQVMEPKAPPSRRLPIAAHRPDRHKRTA